MIDQIDTRIAAIIAGTESNLSEDTIGNTSKTHDARSLKTLMDARAVYVAQLGMDGTEDMSAIDFEIGPFGAIDAQFVGGNT